MNPHRRPPHNQPSAQEWEALIRRRAGALAYPPTPDIAERVRLRLAREGRKRGALRRQLAWAAGILLALLIGLWSVPPVRAAILEFIQIGAVRIWLVEPAPTPPPAPLTPATAAPTPTARLTPTVLPSLFNLAGATTLAEAERRAGFPIRMPTYPTELGEPDGVFYQDMNGPVVVLVWLEPEEPSQARYSLQIMRDSALVYKMQPPVVMSTTVNGNPAIWTHGPYLLAYQASSGTDWQSRYLVTGHVLIWEAEGLTYRLESDLSQDEAKRMAESLP
jgi:hypothetical protein